MLGLFRRREKELASLVWTTFNYLARKYLPLSNAEFVRAIERDFDPNDRQMNAVVARVSVRALPDCTFEFALSEPPRQLLLMGQGPLLGLLLWTNGQHHTVSACDLAVSRCTAEARRIKLELLKLGSLTDADAPRRHSQ